MHFARVRLVVSNPERGGDADTASMHTLTDEREVLLQAAKEQLTGTPRPFACSFETVAWSSTLAPARQRDKSLGGGN
jgi:hypothetical protein